MCYLRSVGTDPLRRCVIGTDPLQRCVVQRGKSIEANASNTCLAANRIENFNGVMLALVVGVIG